MSAADFPVMTAAELRTHVERRDAFVIDLRAHRGRDQMTGAIRYDPKHLLEAPRLVLPLPKGSGTIVLYDERGVTDRLLEIAEKLRNDGYGKLFVLDGGYEAWRAAGGATEEPTMDQPIPEVEEQRIIER